jgi:hypothetical protein
MGLKEWKVTGFKSITAPVEIVSYPLFAEPAYYKIRVGDFRTKTEATKFFLLISKVFPDAYIVPDIINFPDQNNK